MPHNLTGTSTSDSRIRTLNMGEPFGPGIWVLTNVKHKEIAMDLSGGDNQSIIAFRRHGGPNQQWEFTPTDGGCYTIRNVGTGKWLTFPDDANDGKQVIGHDGPRPWEVRVGHEGVNVKDPEESIRIFVPGSDKNLDLKDHGDPTEGNIVQLWERTAGKGQAWYFARPPRAVAFAFTSAHEEDAPLELAASMRHLSIASWLPWSALSYLASNWPSSTGRS
ncbi:hypothetical protein CTheo_5614 [Ceratobasidium theobromae]|uniref:Ricin B lectin domain-containing protein n=1 Tax=Ceratobasidium theobromae TaxID=1582974 RepID=A0A5N5QHL4_9AGAM|nr:hypothetical protein CTheo_5614 [Ceratobasidium theobromae]